MMIRWAEDPLVSSHFPKKGRRNWVEKVRLKFRVATFRCRTRALFLNRYPPPFQKNRNISHYFLQIEYCILLFSKKLQK